MVMQPKGIENLPRDLGSIEQDGAAPIPPAKPVPPEMGTGEPDGIAPGSSPMEDGGITPEMIEAHLDAMPDEDKAFLAEHLTPEFIRAISLISGQEVGNYLNQYVDQNKVLVPVPREVAEQEMGRMKSQQPVPAQPNQGTPAPQAPAAAPSMPGVMAPSM